MENNIENKLKELLEKMLRYYENFIENDEDLE